MERNKQPLRPLTSKIPRESTSLPNAHIVIKFCRETMNENGTHSSDAKVLALGASELELKIFI